MALYLFPRFEALIAHLFGALFATDAKISGKEYSFSQVGSRSASDDYLRVVKMIGRFERKVWPHVNLGLNALHRLIYVSSVKGSQRETCLVFFPARLPSQASLLGSECERPSFWHNAANHFDKWHYWPVFVELFAP